MRQEEVNSDWERRGLVDRVTLRGALGRGLAKQQVGRDECYRGRWRPGRVTSWGAAKRHRDDHGSFSEVRWCVREVEALQSGVLSVRASSWQPSTCSEEGGDCVCLRGGRMAWCRERLGLGSVRASTATRTLR